jgi:rubrerythrin
MNTSNGTWIPPRPGGRRGRARGDPDALQGPRHRSWLRRLVEASGVVLLASLGGSAFAADDTALGALEIAHAREQNSCAQYRAFAAGAQREGQYAAAWLFRVVASAESVHAARVAAAIEQLGGRLVWRLESVVVRSTADNLRYAIEMEKQEREWVYPRLAAYAREECRYEAAAAIAYARTAEGTHAARFAEMIGAVERPLPQLAKLGPGAGGPTGSDGPVTTFYLCAGDGSVFASPVARSCPNCGSSSACVTALVAAAPGNWASLQAGRDRIASR